MDNLEKEIKRNKRGLYVCEIGTIISVIGTPLGFLCDYSEIGYFGIVSFILYGFGTYVNYKALKRNNKKISNLEKKL